MLSPSVIDHTVTNEGFHSAVTIALYYFHHDMCTLYRLKYCKSQHVSETISLITNKGKNCFLAAPLPELFLHPLERRFHGQDNVSHAGTCEVLGK